MIRIEKRNLKLEFKKEDAWIGVHWKRSQKQLDIWICIIPFLPIHYTRTINEIYSELGDE